MADIRFYDFDFNLLYILPPYAVDRGYTSINAEQQMNDSGSFEMVFVDSELKQLVIQYKDTLLVKWRSFDGFITSFQTEGKAVRLFGMHLNGLLHRAVIPIADNLSGDVQTIAKKTIADNLSWLVFNAVNGFTNEITYSTDKYLTADEYLQSLFKLDNAGYVIKADVNAKQYIFECIKTAENQLMISQSNLNAYDFQTTYTNKELAFGGWYQKEQKDGDPVWTYIAADSTKTGIHRIDTVLSAKTATEAENELKNLIAEYSITAKTKDLTCGVDYKIGDIVRVQSDGVTQKRLVSGLSLWDNKGYGEEPILTEVTV